jgi:ABC-type dipeptide/oligopeptide/nickel transport system permease component
MTAFRNASVVDTLSTNVFLAVLLGTFFAEYAFNWPGLGQLLVYSIVRRDLPVVQGAVLSFAAIIVALEWTAGTARALHRRAP